MCAQIYGPVDYAKIAEKLREELPSCARAMSFKAYGYRHHAPSRPCNDVYDVVATKDYYIANDRDLYASPQVKELVTYGRYNGERIAAKEIGNDCSLDINDEGSKVIYYNAVSGYIEEADIPNLDNVKQLFSPGWPAGSNSIVKYIPNETDILIAAKGGTVVQKRSRTGTVVDSITTTNTVVAAAMEPDNWLIATYEGAGRATLRYYKRTDKSALGIIDKLYDGFLNIHVKIPFVTLCSDKGPAIVTEFGGVPFNIYYLNTNSLYPILEENMLVGTYYFSIFELPLLIAQQPILTQCYIKRVLDGAPGSDNPKIPVGGSWDISFLRGMHLTVKSDQPLQIELREPVPVEPYGYSRIYTSPTPEYITLDVITDTVARINVDVKTWLNVNLTNVGSTDATVKIVGGY